MFEVEIYPITLRDRDKTRKQKLKESSIKQKNLNDKNAKKHFIRLVHSNFTDADITVHLTYDPKHLPGSLEEAKKDVVNYMRRINRYRIKNGLPPLKYIIVTEYREPDSSDKRKRIRIHHHLIMSEINRDIAEQLWGKGRANADRLQSDEYGYEALARYITKDPKGNKRWTQSRNLKQPIVKINDYKYTKKKTEQLARCREDRELFEKMYPGYTFTDCQLTVNDDTASIYLHIKMRAMAKRA